MKLLPYHQFEIRSPMTREQAMQAMAAHIEPVKWFRFNWPSSGNDKRFTGELTAEGFRVQRIMGYRNSFAPATDGIVHAAGSMSRIVVTMRPTALIFVFGAIVAIALLASLATGEPRALLGLPMGGLIYFLVLGAFWFEANKQERALREIFRAL